MTTYTVNYTETENNAMAYATADFNDWIQNAAQRNEEAVALPPV